MPKWQPSSDQNKSNTEKHRKKSQREDDASQPLPGDASQQNEPLSRPVPYGFTREDIESRKGEVEPLTRDHSQLPTYEPLPPPQPWFTPSRSSDYPEAGTTPAFGSYGSAPRAKPIGPSPYGAPGYTPGQSMSGYLERSAMAQPEPRGSGRSAAPIRPSPYGPSPYARPVDNPGQSLAAFPGRSAASTMAPHSQDSAVPTTLPSVFGRSNYTLDGSTVNLGSSSNLPAVGLGASSRAPIAASGTNVEPSPHGTKLAAAKAARTCARCYILDYPCRRKDNDKPCTSCQAAHTVCHGQLEDAEKIYGPPNERRTRVTRDCDQCTSFGDECTRGRLPCDTCWNAGRKCVVTSLKKRRRRDALEEYPNADGHRNRACARCYIVGRRQKCEGLGKPTSEPCTQCQRDGVICDDKREAAERLHGPPQHNSTNIHYGRCINCATHDPPRPCGEAERWPCRNCWNAGEICVWPDS